MLLPGQALNPLEIVSTELDVPVCSGSISNSVFDCAWQVWRVRWCVSPSTRRAARSSPPSGRTRYAFPIGPPVFCSSFLQGFHAHPGTSSMMSAAFWCSCWALNHMSVVGGHGKNKQPSADSVTKASEPLCDALMFEPIPYRSALKEGCTHVLVLRTRPDEVKVTGKISIFERLTYRRFFRWAWRLQIAHHGSAMFSVDGLSIASATGS